MSNDLENYAIAGGALSPQRVDAGVHDEAAGAKYLCRVVAVPIVRVVVKAQVEAQTLCVQPPTFDIRCVDWESRRALKVTEESEDN